MHCSVVLPCQKKTTLGNQGTFSACFNGMLQPTISTYKLDATQRFLHTNYIDVDATQSYIHLQKKG